MSTSKENKTKVKKQNYFIDDWLQHEAFSNWLVNDKNDNTKARYSVCHTTVKISSSGRSALTDHVKGMKHISPVNKVSTFFQSKISKKSGPAAAKNKHVNSTIVVGIHQIIFAYFQSLLSFFLITSFCETYF